jgi:thiosulfate reductase cytochrome b subunit
MTGSPAGTRRIPLRFVWVALGIAVVLVVAAVASRTYLSSEAGRSFIATYPGISAVPDWTPAGFPWWVQIQHSLNFLFIILLIRSGWLIRSQARPEAYWTRDNSRLIRTARPPTKMSIHLWLHLSMDVLWLLNGAVFIVLMIASGHWGRVVPTHWDIVPNAVSAGLQYASFDWPLNDPWVDYNALQMLTYFAVIFILAPLAALTGVRMSPVWRAEWRISRLYPASLARRIHLPVMLLFSAFIVVHLGLVLSTGALENLDVMYSATGQGSRSWWGLVVFAAVMLCAVAAWVLARPMFMTPIASRAGRVSSR